MDRRSLSSLFSIGIALAATDCGSEPKGAATPSGPTSTTTQVAGTSPSATSSVTVAAPKPTAVEQLAARLEKVDYVAKTQSGVEYLGFVTFSKGELTCPHDPCPKEWVALLKKPDVQHLIARKNGALVAVTAETFASVLGPIETAAEAVMVARLAGFRLATCTPRGKKMLECRPASGGSGLRDTVTTDAFYLATLVRFQCPQGDPGERGYSLDLGFIRVAKDGKISHVAHRLAELAADELRGHARCPPQRMRGRRFEGYRDLPSERCALSYLVRAHREEAAAVVAFERLADDLARFDAPAALIERARTAARDERRHAAVFLAEAGALAAHLGMPLGIPDLEAPSFEARSLDAVLLENAVEGCANETGAAIVATYQAAAWPDGRMRPALERIASDERTHSALAYDVHAWGQTVLDRAGSERIESARVAAVSQTRQTRTSPIALAMGEPDSALVTAALSFVAGELYRRRDARVRVPRKLSPRRGRGCHRSASRVGRRT